MTNFANTAFSILELAAVREGQSIQATLHHSLQLAQYAEELGYSRMLLAEHHNMNGIASSATSVLLSYLLSNTSHLVLGSGGIMLPNHPPLVVAEQFGTLATLFPNRVVLGLGRAPGTDPVTMRALRRGNQGSEDQFPQDVLEILQYFKKPRPNQQIIATPGQNTHVPVLLLGSSLFSAQLAAQLGLPYAFASHFAPRFLEEAIKVYRENFQPSEYLSEPYLAIGVPTVVAETDEEAEYLATTAYQRILALLRGHSLKLKPPISSMQGLWSAGEEQAVKNFYGIAQIGSINSVQQGLIELAERYPINEFIFTCDIYDVQKNLNNFKYLMQIKQNV